MRTKNNKDCVNCKSYGECKDRYMTGCDYCENYKRENNPITIYKNRKKDRQSKWYHVILTQQDEGTKKVSIYAQSEVEAVYKAAYIIEKNVIDAVKVYCV